MDIRPLARKLDFQIVFEGTVRHDNNLLRLQMDFRSGLNGSKRSQICKILPQSLSELHRRSQTASGRPMASTSGSTVCCIMFG
jgi:hypothetical protein